MIITELVSSNQDEAEIIAILLEHIDDNCLILGDIHAPMNKLSDVYKIIENDKIVGGWTIFHGFRYPIIMFPPLMINYWSIIKEEVKNLNIEEFYVPFPIESNNSYPWQDWSEYSWEHLFTDIAMKFTNNEIEDLDVNTLPKIRAITKEDLKKIDQFYSELVKEDKYEGFWNPVQLDSELFVVAETDDNEFVAAVGTHFETPFTVQIGNLYVKPEYRGKKIGKAITISVVLGIHRSRRIPTLFVNENNTIAINLYRNLGFEDYNKFVFFKATKISK